MQRLSLSLVMIFMTSLLLQFAPVSSSESNNTTTTSHGYGVNWFSTGGDSYTNQNSATLNGNTCTVSDDGWNYGWVRSTQYLPNYDPPPSSENNYYSFAMYGIDENGDTAWIQKINSSISHKPQFCGLTSDGSLIFGARYLKFVNEEWDSNRYANEFHIAKIDRSGHISQHYSYSNSSDGGSGSIIPRSIYIDYDTNKIFVGGVYCYLTSTTKCDVGIPGFVENDDYPNRNMNSAPFILELNQDLEILNSIYLSVSCDLYATMSDYCLSDQNFEMIGVDDSNRLWVSYDSDYRSDGSYKDRFGGVGCDNQKLNFYALDLSNWTWSTSLCDIFEDRQALWDENHYANEWQGKLIVDGHHVKGTSVTGWQGASLVISYSIDVTNVFGKNLNPSDDYNSIFTCELINLHSDQIGKIYNHRDGFLF